MTNIHNRSLLEGEHKDFGSAIDSLKTAMSIEASTNSDDPGLRKFFLGEAEKCQKAKEIYDKIYDKFRKDLAHAMVGAGLDEFVPAIEADDYSLLGY